MEINITYDDELNEGEYGHPASMKVRTYYGKSIPFTLRTVGWRVWKD